MPYEFLAATFPVKLRAYASRICSRTENDQKPAAQYAKRIAKLIMTFKAAGLMG